MYKYGIQFAKNEQIWFDSFEDAMTAIKKSIDSWMFDVEKNIVYPPYIPFEGIPQYIGCVKVK